MNITRDSITEFTHYLRAQEKSALTISKYERQIESLAAWLSERPLDKNALIQYKKEIIREKYKPSTVNTYIACINKFLIYLGKPEWKLKTLRVQKKNFINENQEITRGDYIRIINAAYNHGDERMALVLQTLGVTGIRISELNYITIGSVIQGRCEIRLKGKIRIILIPEALCEKLKSYCRRNGIKQGPVFVTSKGKGIHRSYIWRRMKKLASIAGLPNEKVYPHNFRHFFAREYYGKYHDIVNLADILGHSNVNTTRIYTMRSGEEVRRQIENLHLII